MISNIFHPTMSLFYTFNTFNGATITVTDHHVMKVYRNYKLYALPADAIEYSDQLVSLDGDLQGIASIYQFEEVGKHEVITASGTVLANELHVSTICEGILGSSVDLFTWNVTIYNWLRDHAFN